MLNFFKKIFATPEKPSSEEPDFDLNSTIVDTTIIDKEDPDTRFARLYNETGGKFLYAENADDIRMFLQEIVAENTGKNVWCVCSKLKELLSASNIPFTAVPDAEAQINFITCEYLIAFNGSILISSDQTDHRKIHEISNTYIILAYPDQIVDNIQEGLRNIKRLKSNNLPTNITTIKGSTKEGLSPNAKNIYLILTERP